MVVLVAFVALAWQRELAALGCFCVDEVCDIPARGKRLATNPLPTGSHRDHQRLQFEGSARWGRACQDDVGFQADFVGPRKHADAPHAVAAAGAARQHSRAPRETGASGSADAAAPARAQPLANRQH